MKKYLLIALLLTLSACTSKTEFGDCVGLFDDKKPDLTYKISGWNALMGVIGTSIMFVPTIFVLKDETFCPIGKK